ncbi:type IV secretory system conjugative DNA transfer family protein [Xanthomonas translucens pv. translucens]|uniref:Type IV secretory system conjugative DNA transfer family protein n=4 Tax=Xanthomonas campestris pv. translucens TaxID=343 RepID=A0ABW9KTC5_XANCT|nr:type IV secretory system conjugative DNA transfer family protein [Xanthomonas translucens]MCT8287732.1 type IV secretory system conjugative DNA transfer family protein [Xanthomonas translucens pv. translucens]MCT8305390.1 type IV secretory system conjugative DNA transfer family protein [Xanthomonas translucens pv. translucens]QSQ29973.1 type IV secretory system conjugative DNA transfer family protein [Xanthomonas translucens pv. translucens]UKE50187.1 type IV secretory system conjugative DNA
MSERKLGIAVALLLAALMGGLYFSDWLVLRLLGLKNTPLAWNTWLQYVQVKNLPQYAPFAGKIKLAGALGFGLPMLGWMLALVALFKPRAESTHGDARFADLRDLKKAGLLKQTPQSILIGKYKGRYLWLGGAQHVIAISPTRSGKTTSIAIPVLLSYMHSMVVLDLKGELHKATSGWRQAQGHRIRVWAPYDDAGMTHRFNPMTLLAWTTPDKRLGDIQTIAAILYPDEQGKDPFWTSQSRAAFSAFASYMFEAWDHTINELMAWKAPEALFPSINASPKFPSLERILRFSSGENGKSTLQTLQDILKNPKYTYISPQTRTVFGNLAGLAEQTFSSVIATMQAPLQQFLSPTLAAATNATDIDILSLRKCPTTLYVIIPTNKLDESSKLLNIFFSSLIGNNLGKQLGEEPDLQYQMLMLMDEFTAMGRVDVWSKRISISASYGVRDLCIVQSRAQLRSTYGDNDAQNFITNHGAQVVFAPREQSDANEYSEMLGYKTVRKQQRSRSSGGGASQISISYVEEKRALFLPQEIKELPSDDELIFYEGSKPILAQKNWFFKDKEFKARAAMPPARIKVVGHDAQMALPEHVIQVQNEKDVNRLS